MNKYIFLISTLWIMDVSAALESSIQKIMQRRSYEKFEEALNNGLDPNTRVVLPRGSSRQPEISGPLIHHAIKNKFLRAIILLLMHKDFKVDVTNDDGQTPVQYADKDHFYPIVALLIVAGADQKGIFKNAEIEFAINLHNIEFAINLHNYVTKGQFKDKKVQQAFNNVWNQKNVWGKETFKQNLNTIAALNSQNGFDIVTAIELALMLAESSQSFAIEYFEKIYKEWEKLSK